MGATEGWRGNRGSLSGGTIKWGCESRGYVGVWCLNALKSRVGCHSDFGDGVVGGSMPEF